MIGNGERAPAFELPDQTGQPTTLAALLQNGPLVLFFYPADFTPICTREACLVRDVFGELAAAGVGVAGISPDSVESHARFHAAKSLNYPLLADPEKQTIAAYGVGGPFGFGVRRATFLIDAAGVIVDTALADLRLGKHEELLRRAIGLSQRQGSH